MPLDLDSFLPVIYNLSKKYNYDAKRVTFELNTMFERLENLFALGDFRQVSVSEITETIDRIIRENMHFEIVEDLMQTVYNTYTHYAKFELDVMQMPGNGDCMIHAILVALNITDITPDMVRRKFAHTVFHNEQWLQDFVETTFESDFIINKDKVRRLTFPIFEQMILDRRYYFDEVGLNFMEHLFGFSCIVFNDVPSNESNCVVQSSRASMISFTKETRAFEITKDTKIVFLYRVNCNHVNLLHSKFMDRKHFLASEIMNSPYKEYINEFTV